MSSVFSDLPRCVAVRCRAANSGLLRGKAITFLFVIVTRGLFTSKAIVGFNGRDRDNLSLFFLTVAAFHFTLLRETAFVVASLPVVEPRRGLPTPAEGKPGRLLSHGYQNAPDLSFFSLPPSLLSLLCPSILSFKSVLIGCPGAYAAQACTVT